MRLKSLYIKWLAIGCLFSLVFWIGAITLNAASEAGGAIKAGTPSVGLVYIAVFLLWFVLFIIPSWFDLLSSDKAE